MRNFLKIIFGSCLGVIAAFFLLIAIGVGMAAAFASGVENKQTVKANTVLHLKFDALVPEQTGNTEVDYAEFSSEKKIGLHDMVRSIAAAKSDDKVKGIYLDMSSIPVGSASTRVIREALVDFQTSDKFIIAYSKSYDQGAYHLASVADKVFVHPMGGVDWRGYGAVLSFFKDMLEEIGVEMEVFKVGKFKGAVEPFVRNDLSEENRLQIRQYVQGLWEITKQDVAASRRLSVQQLEQIANDYAAFKANGALQTGLVDAVGYEDEAHQEMRTRMGLEDKDKITLMAPQAYFSSVEAESDYSVKDKIAVVYAEGGIVDGEGGEAQIGDEEYVEVLRKLRKDDNIKAIVLRVNSGGGSAVASENIWRELKLCREAGKPIVTSMGDVAASGGYYIACASDSIFAEPNTITGSIGVFGLFPITKELLDDKLYLNFDSVKTSKFSASFASVYKMTEEEKSIMQNSTEAIYDTFLTRVMEARKYPSKEAVDAVAQGRVWTGAKAKEIGLIDRFGGLPEAVAAAASLAGLTDYRTSEYPKRKDPLTRIIEDFTGEKTAVTDKFLQKELGENYIYYRQFKTLQDMKGVQALMPFNVVLH